MKRIFFLYIIFFTFLISCKTNTSIPTKQDNTLQKLSNSELDSYTFCADIINNSDYEIFINSLIIPTKTIIQNQELPLHSSEIYDELIITYKIPLTDFVFYKHIEKKLIADNQSKIIIENPTKITETESYIIIKNTSNDSVQLTNGRSIFPCYYEGQINTVNISPEYYLKGKSQIVYKINDNSIFFLQNTTLKSDLISINKDDRFLPGYVYTYEFDGKSVYRTDSRPLLKQAEPTWSLEIENNLEINDIEIQKDNIYITGTQIKTDNNSNKYNSAFTCYFETDISTYKEKKLTINYEENQADSTTFFDSIIKEDGNIISVGQRVDKEPNGLVSCYLNSGSLLWNKTLADVYAVFSIIQITENDFFVVGSNSEGKALVYKLKENDSKEFEFITSIEVIDSAIYDTKSCISSDGKYLYLVCNAQENMTNLVISSLFRIDIESGVSEEIKLNNTIRFVEDIKQAKDGTVYLVGETVTDTASSVALMAVKQDIAESKFVYVAPETYSYGRSIYVDEGFNEIVICGTLNATDSSGNGGTPFVRSLYRNDYSVAWEKLYTEECFSDMEVVREFVPCDDYGFVVNLCAVDEEGRFCEPTQLVRTNATGKISENHILIGKD
ncbi:MAG: hypothetical protein IJA53_03940 [Spirochaetaceae bacterium]|nr:hypothetical protein [Spirochaetaceae bacterium]